jgi:hypothetical protein
MDFRLSDDQAALNDGLESLAKQYETLPTAFHQFALVSADLERELAEGGYYDMAAYPELDAVTVALAVERLSRLPCTAEFALSMLVLPKIPGEWPRPLAVVENGQPGRFVATAGTLLLVDGDTVRVARTKPGDTAAVESIFAYPMGRLTRPLQGETLSAEVAAEIRKWLRVALAAEAAGLLQAAITTTVEHLSSRKQFGRPLGAFQALRHRLAECSVLATGVRWLALKAAGTGAAGDAALAALYAQDSATRVAYDVHQMFGGMGVTLEHPLHLWTYRLKALISALGGRGGQAQAVARYCFDSSAAATSSS